METHLRTIIKTLSWRTIAITVTVVISYALLEDLKSSLAIGLGANSIKVVAYYIHERFWNMTRWGRIPWTPQDEERSSSNLDTELGPLQQPAAGD